MKYPSYNAFPRALALIAQVHVTAVSTLSTERTADTAIDFSLLRFSLLRSRPRELLELDGAFAGELVIIAEIDGVLGADGRAALAGQIFGMNGQ